MTTLRPKRNNRTGNSPLLTSFEGEGTADADDLGGGLEVGGHAQSAPKRAVPDVVTSTHGLTAHVSFPSPGQG